MQDLLANIDNNLSHIPTKLTVCIVQKLIQNETFHQEKYISTYFKPCREIEKKFISSLFMSRTYTTHHKS